MAVIHGQLFFAPGIRMRDLDLQHPVALLEAFERRVDGLFLSPVRVLEKCADTEEGALFGAALLIAALVESLARIDNDDNADDSLIRRWLESHLAAFRETVTISGTTLSLAAVFEERFRNGLAHNGYVASLGRLSRAIDAPVWASGPIVTVNPFALAEAVAIEFKSFGDRLRSGARDIRRFAYHVREQFQQEVECARREDV